MTEQDLKARAIDQLRRVRLAEKQLRAWALAYDAGELDGAELLMISLRYAAEVRVYREVEAALLMLGIRVPKEVREGRTTALDWDSEIDVDLTQPCATRRVTTLQ